MLTTNQTSIKILNLSIFVPFIHQSCDPNALVTFSPDDHSIIVYALKPIKKNEQVCELSYIFKR